MGSTTPATQSAAASAALALAQAGATAGAASARLGYQLTTEALKESGAPAVFPLLLLEFTAIGESYAAYIATDAAARFAEVRARAAAEEGAAYWSARTP